MILLSMDDKIKLVTGKGAWHTNDCKGQLTSIRLSDGPHGLRIPLAEGVSENNNSRPATCYPTASAVACSWDKKSVASMAASIAKEAIKEKVDVVLGPGVNIKRSPLCGRNFEYYSEDPFLSGELATSYIKSMQKHGIGTSLKHFAGNSQETHRQTSNSQIDERALREIYLSAFENAVKHANPTTIMASYNRLNGTYACENKHLLTDILRNEWGYEGTVISDWGACCNLPVCLSAGMDLEMPDSLGNHDKQLREALSSGKLTDNDLNRASSNVLKLISACSLNKAEPSEYKASAADKTAEAIATESAVLLKNDGMLPLSFSHSVVVIGDMAVHMRYQGGGSSHIHSTREPNVVKALTDSGYKVLYTKGYSSNTEEEDISLERKAMELASLNLPILFFGGLTEHCEGEGYDRTTLSIPANQTSLLAKICSINDNVAFISFGGAPMDFSFADEIKAILHMYLGGQSVDKACAALISGKANPCGKLAETFPMSLKDTPCYKYFGQDSDDVEYRESIFVGYRYYDTYNIPVRYCFGHGLSYTTFAYSGLSVDKPNYSSGTLSISFTLTNTGNCFGKEITQIYVENPPCNYLRAKKELRGFTKTALAPGKMINIKIELEERSFSIYEPSMGQFIMPSGNYIIHVASSLNDIRLSVSVTVDGYDYKKDDRNTLSEYYHQTRDSFSISREQFEHLYGRKTSRLDEMGKGDFSVYNSLLQLSKHSLLGKIMLRYGRQFTKKNYKGKPADDPELMMFLKGLEDGTIDSIICQSGGLVPYKLAEAVVLSANGHHIKAIKKLIRG